MECDVCGRERSSGLRFHCPACARAAMYPHRIEHAILLSDREKLRKEVEATAARHPPATAQLSHGAEAGDTSTKRLVETNPSDVTRYRDRIEAIVAKGESLRSSIEQYKQEIRSRRDDAARRKQTRDAAAAEFREHSAGAETLKKQVRKSRQSYDRLSAEIVYSRAFLCKDAASKARLNLDKSLPRKHGYILAGIEIPDLRDLNSIPPSHISTSLTQVSHLLALICEYLNIRLPAEITAPHEGWPLPTILPPAASHQDLAASFPRLGPRSGSISPKSTRTQAALDNQQRPLNTKSKTRPRPLFVDRKLPLLAREDNNQYLLFLEGASLLAWDIAWLCRAQGILVAETGRFEDMSCIGKNLWLLLVENTCREIDDYRSRVQRRQGAKTDGKFASSSSTDPAKASEARTPGSHKSQRHTDTSLQSSSTTATHGVEAHLSAGSSSSGKLGVQWAFNHPGQLRDLLKQHLLADMQGAEWEVMEDGDAVKHMMDAEERDQRVPARADHARDEPVVIVGKADRRVRHSIKGSAWETEGAHDEDILAQTAYVDDGEKVNGWTKVKSRAPP